MGVTKEELYTGFLNLMMSKEFGWDEVSPQKRGESWLEDLLFTGTLLSAKGKAIPSDAARTMERRQDLISKSLKNGSAVYLYKKGEDIPREVRFDEGTRQFSVSEPVNQLKLSAARPALMTRYFNLFSLMFRGKDMESVHEWRSYKRRSAAIKNAQAQKRIERRRLNDPILAEKWLGPSEPKERKISLEELQRGAANPEAAEAAREDLKNAAEEAEKEIKIPAPEEPNAVEPEKGKEANADAEPKPRFLEGTEILGASEKEKAFFQAQEAPTEKENKQDLDVEPVEPEIDVRGLKEREKILRDGWEIVERPREPKAGNEFNINNEADDSNLIQEEAKQEGSPCDRLVEQLRRQREQKNETLSKTAEQTIRDLYSDSENAREELRQSCENYQEGKYFAGGTAAESLIAYNVIKRQIENDRDDIMACLEFGAQGIDFLKQSINCSINGQYAIQDNHAPRFFKSNLLNPSGLDTMAERTEREVIGVISKYCKNGDELKKALSQSGPEKEQLQNPKPEAENQKQMNEMMLFQ